MISQIGEYLKETQENTNISLPETIIDILKSAPEQEQAPHELVEWIKQVRIEERHSNYDSWLTVSNLMRTIAIRNYYSPIQYEKAQERASLELQNRTYGNQIHKKYQKLTN
jgi:hypothetical protein